MGVAEMRVEGRAADEVLLRRFADEGQVDAFTELATRHAGLVYATCLRITADAQEAEDLTQDCFLRLARKAPSVRASVAGWLHRSATRASLNAVRGWARRRRHEAIAAVAHAPSREPSGSSSTWAEVAPVLDEAVASLPDELRESIVLHFLAGLPQGEVAGRLGVNQSTVSRRIGEGLRRLRGRLEAAGVAPAAWPLAEALATHAGPAKLPDLASTFAELARAGGGRSAGGIVLAAGWAWGKIRAWAMLLVVLATPAVVEFFAGGWWAIPAAAAWLAYLAWRRPAWFLEGFRGTEATPPGDDPFDPLRRWTWTVVPRGWSRRLARSLAGSAWLAFLSWFTITRGTAGGRSIGFAFAIYASFGLFNALRIVRKAATLPGEPTVGVAAEPAPIETPRAAHAVAMAVAAPLQVACMAKVFVRTGEWGWATATLCSFMAVVSARLAFDAMRKVRLWWRFEGTPAESVSVSVSGHWPVLAYLMVSAAIFTLAACCNELVRHGNPQFAASPQGIRQIEGAAGLCPGLALLFLSISIPPFARIRRRVPGAAWLVAAVIAAVFAVVDLGLCLAYLWPRG